MFVRAVDQVSSNAAAESGAVVHSSQTRARQVDLDDITPFGAFRALSMHFNPIYNPSHQTDPVPG